MVNVEMNVECSVWIVRIDGELTAVSVDEFRRNVAVFMSEVGNTHQYVIDLKAVDFVDSSGFGSLISLVKRIRDMKGEVKLAQLQPSPRRLFDIIHAHKHFEIYESVQDAVNSF